MIIAASAGMLFPVSSFAVPQTTEPNGHVYVLVVITAQGIKLFPSTGVINVSTGAFEPGTFMALSGPIPRGDEISFNVFNRGTKVENFSIFGKTTASIKPGHNAHFSTEALRRGRFLYESTLAHGSESFRGYLAVE